MPLPAIYDLTARTNQGNVFLPYEYISNFVAGEQFVMERQFINIPFSIVSGVTMTVKASKGAATNLVVKTINLVFTGDGVYFPAADNGSGTFTMYFRPDETLLMDERRYFVVEVQFTDGSSNVVSQGYIQGSVNQDTSTGTAIDILIRNLPGSTGLGQLQIDAIAIDGSNNEVFGVILQYFTSNNTLATVNDTGLVIAKAAGTVIITVASTEGNIAKRATLVIT